LTHFSPTETQLSGDASAPSPGIPLAGGWQLWDSILLRGTGFPVQLLEPLAAPAVVSALDSVCALEDRREETVRAAAAICEQPHEHDRAQWRKALRMLRKGRRPEVAPPDAELAALFDELANTDQELSDARNALSAAVNDDFDRISRYLIETARNARFREALIWQNPGMLRAGLNLLARDEPLPNNRIFRRRALAAVSYLQRYCAKNDSIGFFGPVAWSSWDTRIPGAEAVPGPRLVKKRLFRFEHWAIDRLSVELLRRIPKLKNWLPPRRNPLYGLRGQYVLRADNRSVRLQPRYARLLFLCDGQTPACEIARRAVGHTAESFASEQDAIAALEQPPDAALGKRRAGILQLRPDIARHAVCRRGRRSSRAGDGVVRAVERRVSGRRARRGRSGFPGTRDVGT
jgi:hypothetical protein